MSTKFEVDFSESLRQLAEFQAKTKSLGTLLDKIQAESGKPAGAAGRLIREMHQHFSEMERMLHKLGVSAETASELFRNTRNSAQATFAKLAAENLRLTTLTRGFSGELGELERLLKDSAGKQAYVRWAQKAAALQQELAAENRYLVQAIKAAGTAEGQYNQRLKDKLATNKRILNYDHQRRLRTIELENAIQHLSTEEGKAAASAEARLSAARRAAQEDEKRSAKAEELRRHLQSLNGGQAEEIAILERAISARKKKIKADQEAAESLNRLSQAQAEHNARQARATSIASAANRVIQETANSRHRMTMAEARAIAHAEALAAANKKHKEDLLDEARAAYGMSKAQKELSDARQREIDRLTRLRQQKDLLKSGHGQELAAIQRQIQEQQRYNRLLTMTTAELLGLTSAQKKASMANMVGSQSAAMLRAGLHGLNTSIGMYTSATILAASATYAVASAIRSSIALGAEFTNTMARVNAIMSSSKPSWLGDAGQMDAMERQVRALGQTTVFTASEVAQGLMELGMAGLSAGEALIALQPALDLAQVGNVSMAQSADWSTNIMMAFGKEARDLTHIVNVMSMAVTNSNTTFEQLANAMTYAGPAAHAAGISMEDTVAAIEALANAGFKASRAGTGLRRLITSLVNPTKKGREVLEQYSISILDAEGNTRSLVDIIGQLGDKLNHLPGSEKLSAIQNLVGLYATPQVAALVNQADQLKNLRRALDDVTGATARMKQQMEDSLKTDWRMVVSAFEEVQLTAFKSQEARLRNAAAELANWLIELKKPIAEGSDITELDLFLQKAENTAIALGHMAAGFLAFKAAAGAGNFMAALASDLTKVGERAKVLATRLNEARTANTLLSIESAKATFQARKQAVQAFLVADAWTKAGIAMRFATSAVHGLAVGLSALSRALGWAFLIWQLYDALKMLFGSDAEEDILKQKGAVDDLKSSYESLKASIAATAHEQKVQALRDLNLADRRSIDGYVDESGRRVEGMAERLQMLKDLLATLGNDHAARPVLESQIGLLTHQIEKMETGIRDRNAALEQMATTEQTLVSDTEKVVEALKKRKEAQEELAKVHALMNASVDAGAPIDAALQRRADEAQKALRAADDLLAANALLAQAARERKMTLRELSSAEMAEQDTWLNQSVMEKQLTTAQKLAEARKKVAEIEWEIEALHTRQQMGEDVGQDELTRLTAKRREQYEEMVDLLVDAENQVKALAEAEESLWEARASDAERLLRLQQELAGVEGERALNRSLLDKGQLDRVVWVEEETRLLKQQTELYRQIKSLQESMKKASNKPDKDLIAAWSTYTALRKKYDPVGVSEREIAQKSRQLDLLVKTTSKDFRISAEERSKALVQLYKEHYELIKAQDKSRASLEKLRDSYSKSESPVVKHAEEMAELNRLYREGAVGLTEYLRIQQRISEASRKSTLEGLPTASLPSNSDLSSPFTELMNTSLSFAQGRQAFSDREDSLTLAEQSGYDRINEEIRKQAELQDFLLERRLITKQEHEDEMLKLEEQAAQKRLALNKQFTSEWNALADNRAQYEQQMSGLMYAAVMGTAQNLLSTYASISEGASENQRRAWAFMKALAVAQIIAYTELAAAQAMAAQDVPFFGTKVSAYNLIRTLGYASAGIVAGTAAAEYQHSKKKYSGAYDDGGFIPYNSYGIVGEYGPEIVHGPAHVTSREKTARKLSQGQVNQITLSPQIVVHMTSDSAGGTSAEEVAKQAADQVKVVVMETLHDQMRPQGLLDTWLRNQRG